MNNWGGTLALRKSLPLKVTIKRGLEGGLGLKTQRKKGQAVRSTTSNKSVHSRAKRGDVRRAAVRAGKRRKHSSMKLYYFLLMLLIVATGITLSFTVFFHIQTITVEGTAMYDHEKVVEVAGIKIGQNLFLCDTDKAEERLETNLPYIEKASVLRRLPTGIHIKIEEAKAAGQVDIEGRYALISDKGKVLEVMTAAKDNVPEITGLGVNEAKEGFNLAFVREQDKETLFELFGAIKSYGFGGKINRVEFASTSDIILLFDNRIKIKLGAPTTINYKLEFARRVIDEKIGINEKGTLDLSLLSSTSEKASFIPEE